MNEKNQIERAKEIALLAAATLDNKKGMDVTTLEVGEQTILADYFVLATGRKRKDRPFLHKLQEQA